MSSAYDELEEIADEKRREKRLKRHCVPAAYMSRLIFAKAKQVGKPVLFQ